MPDITMCIGGKCPKKQSCHRFTAEPDLVQSMFAPEVSQTGEGNCEEFWDNYGYSKTSAGHNID